MQQNSMKHGPEEVIGTMAKALKNELAQNISADELMFGGPLDNTFHIAIYGTPTEHQLWETAK